MKNNLLFSLIIILFVTTSHAQGFNFDKEAYAERETVEALRGPIPDYASLKPFTPIIYPQAMGDCVAQSFANAITVLIAKNNHMTDQNKITLMRPSPFFIYWSIKEPGDSYCEEGLDAEKAALFLLKPPFLCFLIILPKALTMFALKFSGRESTVLPSLG